MAKKSQVLKKQKEQVNAKIKKTLVGNRTPVKTGAPIKHF